MGIAYVGSANNSGTSAPVSVTYSSRAGNTLVALVRFTNGSTAAGLTSVGDSAGNLWMVSAGVTTFPPSIEFTSGGDQWAALAWCSNAAAVTGVTVNTSSTPSAVEVTIAEFSGVAYITTGGTGAVSGASSVPTTSSFGVNPPGTGVIAVCQTATAQSGPPSGTSALPGTTGLFCYEITSVSGSILLSWPTSATAWGTAIALMVPAPAGIQLIQNTGATGNKTHGAADSLTNLATTKGNTLFAVYYAYYTANSFPSALGTVTDSASNTWTVQTTLTPGPPPAEVLDSPAAGGWFGATHAWCINASPVTSVTLVCNPAISSGTYFRDLLLGEFYGIGSADTAVIDGQINFSGNYSAPSMNLAVPNEVVIGSLGSSTATPGVPSGFSKFSALSYPVGVWGVVSSPGPFSLAYTLSGTNDLAMTATAFKPLTGPQTIHSQAVKRAAYY